MPRPFTPRQIAENRRFLAVLAETGNIRLSARAIGRAYGGMQHRRSACAAFAQEWEAALAAAHARFHLAGGRRGPESSASTRKGKKKLDSRFRGNDGMGLGAAPSPRSARSVSPAKAGEDLRTRGGEAVVVRLKSGKLQLRLAQPGKLTKAAEQAFLAALSATANVRLSAAAAGASARAFYRRRRLDAAFRREFRIALKMGWDRLNYASLQAAMPESQEHDAWRSNDPPPMPPLNWDQALQLLHLHQKSCVFGWDMPHRKKRRGETWEIYSARLAAMWRCEQAQAADDEAVARALRFEETGSWRREDEAEPPPLPPLHLVTGWSKASGRAPHHEGTALFGGWRIADMERRLSEPRDGAGAAARGAEGVKLKIVLTLLLIAMLLVPAAMVVRARLRRGRRGD